MPVNENIMGALSGLAGAVSNMGKTENTDALVSLCLLSACVPLSDAEEAELIELIENEKYTLSPGCKSCASPCGNTSSYPKEAIFAEAEDTKALKYKAAAAACALINSFSEEKRAKLPDCIYSVLVSWKCSFSQSDYLQLAKEIENRK